MHFDPGLIVYCCFIYGSTNHKFYDCPHKHIVTQKMFKTKVVTIKPKNEEVPINMVITITIKSKVSKIVTFKNKDQCHEKLSL